MTARHRAGRPVAVLLLGALVFGAAILLAACAGLVTR